MLQYLEHESRGFNDYYGYYTLKYVYSDDEESCDSSSNVQD